MVDVIAYTDGGCRGNPGIGAWAYVLVHQGSMKAVERSAAQANTTNNRMEMMAAIQALQALTKPGISICIHTDSKLLIDSCTQWMAGWKRNGWKKKKGALKNVDLLQQLDALTSKFVVTWQWVKGHSGERGNEHVDTLLNASMDRLSNGDDSLHERHFSW